MDDRDDPDHTCQNQTDGNAQSLWRGVAHCVLLFLNGKSPTIDEAQDLTTPVPDIVCRKQETKSENNVPMNFQDVVVKRSQYSEYQYLTSSYHAAGGDRQPTVSNNSED